MALRIEGKAEIINLFELVGSPQGPVKLSVSFGETELGPHPTPLITHGFHPDSAVQVNRSGLMLQVGPRKISLPIPSDLSQVSLNEALAMFYTERGSVMDRNRTMVQLTNLQLNVCPSEQEWADGLAAPIQTLITVWPNYMLKPGQWYLQEPGNSRFIVGSWETIT